MAISESNEGLFDGKCWKFEILKLSRMGYNGFDKKRYTVKPLNTTLFGLAQNGGFLKAAINDNGN